MATFQDFVKSSLEADLKSLTASAAAAGILLHVVVIRRGDFEYLADRFIASLALGTLGFFGALATLTSLSIFAVILRVTAIFWAFNGGILLSISLYRLFFHPLRKFPGPRLAKLTHFYTAYLSSKELKYHNEVSDMCDKYGDCIRTGPRELCFVRKSAVPLLYGPDSKCIKSTWYLQQDVDPKRSSLFMIREPCAHKTRRRAWDKGIIDVILWTALLPFDVMGEVAFSKDLGGVEQGVEQPAIAEMHSHMAFVGTLIHVPWLLNFLGRLRGATGSYGLFFSWCQNQLAKKQKQLDMRGEDPQDIVSWLVQEAAAKRSGVTPAGMDQDSRVAIIAGSDSTQATLASAVYLLAKYPAVLAKLQEKIDSAMPNGSQDWSYDKIRNIPYLDDVLKETLRLKGPVVVGACLQVDEVFIPPHTNVFEPRSFIPERWGEREAEMETAGQPFLAFHLGPFNCAGKTLAMMVLRVTIARIVQSFDVSFPSGETGDHFGRDAQDTFGTKLPPMGLRFVPRQPRL
ncbi:putative benzoate 4-monooxygenase cytochrome P450 [Phyllosticta citriasiana]|uniref:Benzoate 4-monooxygenase cytochrome P450 n=1 Tax=Phyllosticta citriasiana TaxID=595635 RepID=A0ABR1KQ89_9PEZI